jgi:hypothetical protein
LEKNAKEAGGGCLLSAMVLAPTAGLMAELPDEYAVKKNAVS